MLFLLTLENGVDTGYSSGYAQMIFVYILVLVVLLFGAFFVVKFFGGGSFTTKSNIKIIERKSIGFNNYLLIISVEDKFYLLSQTKDRVTLIDTFDEITIYQNNKDNFSDIFNKYLGERKLNNKNLNVDKGNDFEDRK